MHHIQLPAPLSFPYSPRSAFVQVWSAYSLVESLFRIGTVYAIGVLGFFPLGLGDGANVAIVLLVPVIHGILVPRINLLFQRLASCCPSVVHRCRSRHYPLLLTVVVGRQHRALAKLDVLDILAGDGVVGAAGALTLEHALVVPVAEGEPGKTAHDVGDDVVEVEDAAVGQEALEELGANAEDGGADDQGKVRGAPAIRVDDPVEDHGQQEKGEEVQDLVVNVGVELQRREADVAGEEAEQEEDTCGRERPVSMEMRKGVKFCGDDDGDALSR